MCVRGTGVRVCVRAGQECVCVCGTGVRVCARDRRSACACMTPCTHRGGCTYIEVVVDLHHGRVDTRSQALHL